MRIMRNNAVKVSKNEKEEENTEDFSALQWANCYKTIFHLFLPGVAQHVGCDGMRRGLRKKVNGPVNNGASASLHSVSI